MRHDLVLSSGFLAFAHHAGFLAAVEDTGLAVDGVCGTSSGALLGSLWASGLPAREALRRVSERSPLGWCRPHLAVWRGLFTLEAMIEELGRHLPRTFEELPRPLGVGVVGPDGHRIVSAGPLPEAVAASCAVPHLFAPVPLGGRPHLDGARADRLGAGAWRALRPDRPWVVHAIDRSGGTEVPADLGSAVVVRSPRSGATLWSLGDVDAQFQATRARARRALEEGRSGA